MTLGRTSSGAIKIKTDGGLRAVECGCCGGCKPVTLEQYNAVAYGGTADLAGPLSAIFKNVPFIQEYSYSYTTDDSVITEGYVVGYKYKQTKIGNITCEDIDVDLYHRELVIVRIDTKSTVYNDPAREAIYELNAYEAVAGVSEDYACGEDPYFPKYNDIYLSAAYCGPELYLWLMAAGPSQPPP
jgi:hypothetical protein